MSDGRRPGRSGSGWSRWATVAVLVGAGLAVPASGVVGAEPCTGAKLSEATAVREAVRCQHPVVISGETTPTTELTALPDGTVLAVVHAGIVRVRRGDGWVPVDLTLRTDERDGSIAPAAHPYDLRISAARPAGLATLATLGLGDDRLSVGWAGALPEPVLDGTRATYVDALPGVDVVVEATREGMETYFVAESPAAARRLARVTLPVTGRNATRARMDSGGSLVVEDVTGRVVARSPAPQMWDAVVDAAGQPVNRAPVALSAGRSGEVALTLEPDLAWLTEPGRRYPVTIDPQLNPVSVSYDTFVIANSGSDNSGANDLRLGRQGSTGPVTRSLLRWNTAALVGKQITSATVNFWNWYSPACAAMGWELWTVTPIADGVVWDNQPAWTNSEATSTATKGFDATCDDGWVSISGTSFFQRAADAGDGSADMGLRAVNETEVAYFKQLRSQLTSNAGHVPYAVVNYNSYPQVISRATVPSTPCVTGTGRPVLQTLTPTLQATVTDAEGTAMSVVFEWSTLTGALVGSATVSGVASGATASATVPPGSFQLSGSYRWRVRVSDGTGTTYSSYCEFTLYEVAPPASGCIPGVDADFNGDGARDVAIADPDATVGGKGKAGAVYIVDGASGTVTTLTQDSAEVPDVAESSARFGHALAVADINVDGCSDLVVGVPLKNIGTVSDAGSVYLLFGAPAGLAKGPASMTIQQGLDGTPETAESSDYFGFAVAAGRTAAGKPFLVVGAPGENLGSATDAGTAHYLFGAGANALINQSTTGGSSTAETYDRVGYAVAGSPHHVVLGGPGEAVGTGEFAGMVNVFTHTLTGGVPTYLTGIHQDTSGVSGASEAGDMFGRSISIAPYRPVGAPAGQPDSLLVVGVPGEDFTSTEDAGMVQRFHLTATGFTELPSVSQSSTGMADGNESGDYFGDHVLVVNTDPAAEASASTLLVAVGAPGEDLGTAADAGSVHVFAAAANPVAADVLVQRANPLVGSPTGLELVGLSLGASSRYLYVGTPHGAAAVFAVPWSSLAAGSAVPALTWQPGVSGVPAGGFSFGATVG